MYICHIILLLSCGFGVTHIINIEAEGLCKVVKSVELELIFQYSFLRDVKVEAGNVTRRANIACIAKSKIPFLVKKVNKSFVKFLTDSYRRNTLLKRECL